MSAEPRNMMEKPKEYKAFRIWKCHRKYVITIAASPRDTASLSVHIIDCASCFYLFFFCIPDCRCRWSSPDLIAGFNWLHLLLSAVKTPDSLSLFLLVLWVWLSFGHAGIYHATSVSLYILSRIRYSGFGSLKRQVQIAIERVQKLNYQLLYSEEPRFSNVTAL